MDNEELALVIDLHMRQRRQGPGGETELRKMLAHVDLNQSEPLRVADIGCGTGASTLPLATLLNADIIAVDFLPEFLETLKSRAEAAREHQKISPLVCSMDQLPFEENEFDLIWSEGAIYNMGFEKGVTEWRKFLKPGGTLVVSEVTWTTGTRPHELQEYWDKMYPEIATASEKIRIFEANDYTPVGYFVLPESCWLKNYYDPLENQIPDFLKRHKESEKALTIAKDTKHEIEFYKKYKSFYSYGVYVSKKI